jgi:holo-[acyl-carrier protein] synthase
MIIKTGIDVIEVSRIEENITKFGDSFLNRIYTEKEIEYCESKNVQKYQSYAGRFAAKEAIFKAISEFLDNKFDIKWKDIEVLNDETGRPFINYYGNDIGDISFDVSISHISSIAVASVIVKMEV